MRDGSGRVGEDGTGTSCTFTYTETADRERKWCQRDAKWERNGVLEWDEALMPSWEETFVYIWGGVFERGAGNIGQQI